MLSALVLGVTLLGAPPRAPEAVSLRTFAAASPRPAPCRSASLFDENSLWERTRGGVTERYCALLAFGYARLRSAPNQALEFARQAEKLYPKLAEPRVLAGRALLRQGDFAGAYASLSSSVSDPARPLGDVAALRELAVAAQFSGHLPESAAAYRALVPRVAFTSDPTLVRIVTLEAASVLALEGAAGLSDAILYLSESRRTPSVPGFDDLATAMLATSLDRAGNSDQAEVLARGLEGGFALERFATPRDRERLSGTALGGSGAAARAAFEFNERAPNLVDGELHALIGFAASRRDARLARAHLQAYAALKAGPFQAWAQKHLNASSRSGSR
ncbi:MAG: hypothetical protein ACOY0T_04600 [Myxococcota bacterium]